MASSFSIAFGNFLYKNCFPLYRAAYARFKKQQDAFEISLLRQYIKPGDVVLDIGANIGFYTALMSDIVGAKGMVHGFEPDQTNFRHLRDHTKGLQNVRINHKAVADKTQVIKIYTSKQLNVDHRTYKPAEYEAELDIDAIAIDDYLAGQRVDFIKMDIQGFEWSAVQGMTRTFSENNIQMLSEFWPYGMRQAGTSVLAYFQLLKQLGFNVYLIKDKALRKLTEDQVAKLTDLPKSEYMNIFVTKNNV